MKIAIVAPSVWYPIVPPIKSLYGGGERIVHWLTEELVRLGHDVTLFAPGDSQTSAELIPTCDCSTFGRDAKSSVSWDDITDNLLGLKKALEMTLTKKFDLIHSHVYGDPLITSISEILKIKVISTIHNSLSIKDMGLRNIIPYRSANNRKYHRFVALSKSQVEHDDAKLKYAGIVYNGVNLADYKIKRRPKRKSDTFLFLSRIDPMKGIECAIEAAAKAGVKLIIAGRLLPGRERNYFKEQVEPRLEKGVLEYVGEISDTEKIRLLYACEGVIFPPLWREPCPVVPIEAGACGTPVIAFSCGSVPELVADGTSGFVVPPYKNGRLNITDLTNAIQNIDQIDTGICYSHVQNNFTSEIMTENYLNIY